MKPAWLLMEMQVQDAIGHEAWGLYSALLSLGFLLIVLADLGISPYFTRALATDPEGAERDFPGWLGLKIFLLMAYPLLLAAAGWLLGYRGAAGGLLILVAAIHGGAQMGQLFRAWLQGKHLFQLDSLLSVLDRVLLLGAVAWLLAYGIEAESFAWARIFTLWLTAAAMYLIIVRRRGPLVPQAAPAQQSAMLRRSLPFALMVILYALHDKIDQVMLERMAGSLPNGLYAGAYRWLDAFSMYLWTVLPLFFPRFAARGSDPAAQAALLRPGQVITALPMLFAGAFVWSYGGSLLFLYRQSSAEELAIMVECLRALFVAAALNGVFAIFSTVLTASGHERAVNRIIAGSIAANILLNALLIPHFGAAGAAWATVASYALLDLAYAGYLFFRLRWPVPWRQTGLLLLLGLAIGLIMSGLKALDLPAWAAVAVGLPLFAVLAWAADMVRILRHINISGPAG